MKRMHDDSEVKKLAVTALKPFLEEIASTGLKREIVTSLPTGSDIKTNVIYMILDSMAPGSGNLYNEYLYINNNWELIGKSQPDMVNPMTSAGDMIYGDAQGNPERLPRANVGDILKMGRVNNIYKPVWGEDNYLEVYELALTDIESESDGVYTFNNAFRDKITSMRYAILIDTGNLQISSGETYLILPGSFFDESDYTQYLYGTPPMYIVGTPFMCTVMFLLNKTTNKLTLNLSQHIRLIEVQPNLESATPQDGTLDKVLGYDSIGNLVKSTNLPILTTAPTQANTEGGIIIVVLSSEPATYYNGYYYIITSA